VLTKNGPPRWSGDGRLLSIGGWIVGRVRLPATQLEWAPTGETAAFQTKDGTVLMWRATGTRTVVPAAWERPRWPGVPAGCSPLGVRSATCLVVSRSIRRCGWGATARCIVLRDHFAACPGRSSPGFAPDELLGLALVHGERQARRGRRA
jgi:hypothetical protein